MRKMKKAVAMLAAAVLLVGSLAGCGGNDTPKTTEGNGTQAEKTEGAAGATELELWTFVELHGKFYEAMQTKWNEANPDKQVKLKISVMPYDDMHNKLQIALNSAEGTPDISDIELGKFSNFTQGTPPLRDLTQEAEPYVKDIVQSRLDIYSKEGKLYGIPTHVGATVAFYNTEMLEAAGIDYTTIKTWDDFKTAGTTLYEKTGKHLGVAETSANWTVNLMLAELGADWVDAEDNLTVNSDGVVKALTTLKELQDANAITTIPGGQPDTEEAYGFYNAGNVACAIMPLWQMSRYTNYMEDLSGKIAISAPPVFDDSKALSIGGGGTGTVVVAGKPNEELAAEFLAYAKLSEEANVAIWDTLGFDPCNMSIWEDETITHNPENEFVKYFKTNPFDTLNEIKSGIAGLNAYTSSKFPSINNNFATVTLNSIFEDGVDVKEALDMAQEDLSNELQ